MRANSWLNQFSLYLFCLFPLLIALPPKGMLAVLFVVLQALVIVTKKTKWNIRGIWFPILQGLPTAFFALSLFYSEDLFYGNKYLETSMMVFFIPWLFYFNRSSITAEVQNKTLKFYTLVVTLFVLYLIGEFVISGNFIVAMRAPDSYYQVRTYLGAKSGMHPTYFSLLLGVAFLTVQAELKKGILSNLNKSVALFCFAVLVVGLLLASSKMILIAVFFGSAVVWGQKWRLKTLLIRVAAGAALFAIIILLIKPMRQRANDLINAFAVEEVNPHNPDSMRKAIYKSTVAVISENFWWGTGIGDSQHALDEKYHKFGFSLAEERQFNTHNNYLHVWLSAGFVPFLFFVLLMVAQLLIALANRNYLHLSIALLFSLSMLTENILSRQDGVFLYAFFSSFLVFATWSKNKNAMLINGRFKTQITTGVQRFAEEISRHLLQKSDDYNLVLPIKIDSNENQKRALPILSGALWEQISLPIFMRLLGSPKLVNLCNSAPIFYRNQVVTLHDVAFVENPKWFSVKFVRWYGFMIPRILKKSTHVFTVSEFSKSEIVNHFKIKPEKISVLFNGMPSFAEIDDNSKPIVEGKYTLSVGTFSARKNQKQIIDCFLEWDNCPTKLVLAGTFDKAIFGQNELLADAIKNAPNIILLENTSDKELANLYRHASFTIYLPYYEGFGLPVLESLAFKKPAIVSDIPVFKELFSSVVLFSPLNNNGNLRGRIEEMLQTEESWVEKINNSTELKSKFSYKTSASKLDEVIHQL